MLRQIKLPLMSWQPGQCTSIQYKEYGRDYEKQEIALMVKELYDAAMEMNQETVSHTFAVIYGAPITVRRALTSEVIIKLKQIMNQTGKTIEQIISEIRQYLGYPCSFFRIAEGRTKAVDGARIMEAYQRVQKRSSIIAVEDALYF